MESLPNELENIIKDYVIFKPKTKNELKKAVDLWCDNKEEAIKKYGDISIWNTSLIVDMSNLLIPKIRDPVILHLCRNIIRKQEYEIWEMTMMKRRISDTVFEEGYSIREDRPSKLEVYYPKLSTSRDGECDPAFFKPDEHAHHMSDMKLTDKMYLEHMIPHHQVAIDMSRRLLMHTNHSYLMDFCSQLIIDQQGEIFYMNQLLQNKINYKSELLE